MGGGDRDLAADRLEGGAEGIGQALAVIVVGLGDGDIRDAAALHHHGQNLALTGVGR